MSYWNHRIVKTVIGSDKLGWEDQYGIHEVYYDDDGKLEAWTMDPVAITSETLDEMKQTLVWIQNAVDKPVIDANEETARMIKEKS